MNTSTYKANRLADNLNREEIKAIGDYSFQHIDGVVEGILIGLPTPKGAPFVDFVPVSRDGQKFPNERRWGWDGNLDLPTLQPSLDLKGCWHGYLCKGMLHSV